MTSDAERVTKALGGTWMRDYGRAPCPAHGGSRENLDIRAGDSVPLLLKCQSKGCEFTEIMTALRELGIIGDGPRTEYKRPEPKPKKKKQEDDQSKIAWAQSIWSQGLPLREGTVAYDYLTKTRGRQINGARDLRAAKAIKYVRDGKTYWVPALLAVMRKIGSNEITAVNRTFIHPKRLTKIERRFAGAAKHTATKLDPLPGGKGIELGIAEGVETALAARQIYPGLPVWALNSAGLIRDFPAPSRGQVRRLFIFADADGVGLGAAQDCARRYTKIGAEVQIIRPRHEGASDIDDVLAQWEALT